jgi:hypothetical protein
MKGRLRPSVIRTDLRGFRRLERAMKPPELELETGLPFSQSGPGRLVQNDSTGSFRLITNTGANSDTGLCHPDASAWSPESGLRFGASVPQAAWQSSPAVPSPLRQLGTATVNVATAPSRIRVTVDGKGFRLGPSKFHAKGVTYGPLTPGADGLPFGTPDTTRHDFTHILSLGANLLRVYHVPPRWFLDLAHEHSLKLLVDVPWNRQQ